MPTNKARGRNIMLHCNRLRARMLCTSATCWRQKLTYLNGWSGCNMLTQDSQERREYYRIQDRIALQISNEPDPAQSSLLFTLLNELYLLDLEAQPLLRSISEQQRTLVNYLKITNKRIDLLANRSEERRVGKECRSR